MSIKVNYQQEKRFRDLIAEQIPNSILSDTIDWIKENLEPNQVFEPDELIKYAMDGYSPDEIFPTQDLDDWATSNGYVKSKS